MKVTVLDFYADWCGPCKQQKPILEELEDEYPDVEFDYVNIESEMETANEYSVQSVPTLVVLDEEGEVHNQMVGLQQKEVVESTINAA